MLSGTEDGGRNQSPIITDTHICTHTHTPGIRGNQFRNLSSCYLLTDSRLSGLLPFNMSWNISLSLFLWCLFHNMHVSYLCFSVWESLYILQSNPDLLESTLIPFDTSFGRLCIVIRGQRHCGLKDYYTLKINLLCNLRSRYCNTMIFSHKPETIHCINNKQVENS